MDLRVGTAIGDDPWKHGESTLGVDLIISKACRETAVRAPDLRPLHRSKIVRSRESSSSAHTQTLQFSYRNSEPENTGCMRSLIWIYI
jgi:hypothetical protein